MTSPETISPKKLSSSTTRILNQENERLHQRSILLSALGEFACGIAEGGSFDSLLQKTVQDCATALLADRFCVFLLHPDGRQMDFAAGIGIDGDPLPSIPLPVGETIRSLIQKNQKERGKGDGVGLCQTFSRNLQTLFFPMIFREVELGLLCISRNEKYPFRKEEIRLLEAVTAQMASAVFLQGPIREMMAMERTERELHYAHALKNELFSEVPPNLRDYRIGVQSFSSLHGGGDFYDILHLSPARCLFLCGETSGRGMQASLHLAHLVPTIRKAVAEGIDFSTLLPFLNERILAHGRRGQMVSLCLLELDLSRHRIRLARAGNTGVFYFGHGKAHPPIEGGGTPLGVLAGIEPAYAELGLAPGEGIFLMTDGIHQWKEIESQGGSAKVLHFLAEFDAHGEVKATDALAQALVAQTDGKIFPDDLTLLSLERLL